MNRRFVRSMTPVLLGRMSAPAKRALVLAFVAGLSGTAVGQPTCQSCVWWSSSDANNTGATAQQTLSVNMSVADAEACPYAMLVGVLSIISPTAPAPVLATGSGVQWDPDSGPAVNLTHQVAIDSGAGIPGYALRSELWTLALPATGSGTLTFDLNGSDSARMSGGGVVLCGVQNISTAVAANNTTAQNTVRQGTFDANGYMFVDNCASYGNVSAAKSRTSMVLNWSPGTTGSTADDVRSSSSRAAVTIEELLYGYNFGTATYYACTAAAFIPEAVTSVGLERFEANAIEGGVALSWKAGQESDNLGYRLFREDGKTKTLLTPDLVAGSALSYPGSPLQAGYSYGWWDPDGRATSKYWLQDVELGGRETLHGPFEVEAVPGAHAPAARFASRTLRTVGIERESAQTSSEIPRRSRVVLDRPDVLEQEAALGKQRELAGRPAAKIVVGEEGLYRVFGRDLVGLRADLLGASSDRLQLFVGGREVAIQVVDGGDRRFDETDYVEFYGVPLDTQYSGTQTYWLVKGDFRGERIPVQGSVPRRSRTITSSFTLEQRARLFYAGGVLNGEAENFFGKVVTATPAVVNVSAPALDRSSPTEARLEVAVQGFSELEHAVSVSVNGVAVGTVPFKKKSWQTLTIPIRPDSLVAGENSITFQETGNPKAASAVGYARLTYPRLSKASDDRLFLTVDARAIAEPIQITGFSSSRIRVFDVTDPVRVVQVRGAVAIAVDGSRPILQDGYSISVDPRANPVAGAVGVRAAPRHLLALTDGSVLRPLALTANAPSTWADAKNGADWIVISHGSLTGAVADLQKAREAQGLRTAVVDVEDVYDEFGFGEKSPAAIRSFLALARTEWKTPPRYVLLLGDGSQDPRDYLGFGSDLVPTKLVDTETVETASDDWMADADGDGKADVALGRLPAGTEAEARAMVAKIVRHETAPRGLESALFVADTAVVSNFAYQNSKLRELVPASVSVSAADADTLGDADTRAAILDSIEQGVDLIHYSGHGTIDHWRGNLLTVADAPSLRNADRLPIVTVANCLTGIFQEPLMDGLGEALVAAPDAGAVAVWGSSGTTGVPGQETLMSEFMKALFGEGVGTIGEAARRAKAAVNDSDVRSTWILLGDPATRAR